MNKRGQGLSLNTIIIAIVVLIVLVVLIMVFTGYFGTRFTPELTSCANAGGRCEYTNTNCGTDVFNEAIVTLRASCPSQTEGGESGLCCSRGIGTGTAPGVADDDPRLDPPALDDLGTCISPATCEDVDVCASDKRVPLTTCEVDANGETTGQVCCQA